MYHQVCTRIKDTVICKSLRNQGITFIAAAFTGAVGPFDLNLTEQLLRKNIHLPPEI